MKLLLDCSYTDGTGLNGRGSFWAESYVKNIVAHQEEGETIHETVRRVIKDIDGAEFSYDGKPQSTVYRDVNGEAKPVGYIYRTKHYIADQHSNFSGYAVFDAWVTIRKVEDLELEEI